MMAFKINIWFKCSYKFKNWYCLITSSRPCFNI